MDEDWECVIVGGGVAGLSAALVLGRARRRTLLLDSGGQSNRPAAHVGGLLAQEGTSPDELYARARDQIALYDSVVIRDAEAVDARAEGEGFVVVLDGTEVRARAVILATGMDYEVPDVPGFREHWGGAVFHCPFCHGWEVRDRQLAVYADGEMADRLAALLRGWSSDVTVVEPSEVVGLRVDDGTVRAVVQRDGSEVPCDAVLVHAPLRRRGRLPERLGLELTEAGFVAVDALAHTSVPGVYAAGDVAVAPQQVAVALASGHVAGLVAARELLVGRPPAVQRSTISQHMLEAMAGVPAFVRNGRLDILGANRLGRALYSEQFDSAAQPPNTARFVFLDPRATTFYAEWERVANDVVAILRAEAGRDPYDRELSDLVGELSTRSEPFRTLWAAHNVRRHDTGLERFHHPLVGDLTLSFEAMELVADPGLTMFVYTAEPGSKSEQALNLLASWAATPDEETTHADHQEQPRHRSGT